MSRNELPKEPYWDGPLSHPFYSKVVKRALDLLLALVLLIPGMVLMIPLAVWVKLDLKEKKVTFIVLARYMQIISDEMIKAYPNKIINIHHSFLPAFIGAKPYHQAYQRGVKIIGATSHYVTADLDAGPIIEQDVVRITHKDTPETLVLKGKDLEKIVLSRAVKKHVERKILTYKNKTIIFS